MASPKQVLDFWFGPGVWGNPELLGQASKTQMPLWFGRRLSEAGVEKLSEEEQRAVDASCGIFAEQIRACARGELTGEAWESHEGLYAKMLLCDQLSRNCFRGTEEAFATDDLAMQYCREIVEKGWHEGLEVVQLMFLSTPIQHSENPADHMVADIIVRYAVDKFGETSGVKTVTESIRDHKAVLDRFGRYPHRNKAKGRTTTDEEKAWLDDVENLPGWAKSQH
mmetsp:Transcript_59041/g.127721  ORF Transcript_59041/g.127721 Transcript_59041/m.127721 type:complete len:224 (-) Transcript_59041:45-716(-)